MSVQTRPRQTSARGPSRESRVVIGWAPPSFWDSPSYWLDPGETLSAQCLPAFVIVASGQDAETASLILRYRLRYTQIRCWRGKGARFTTSPSLSRRQLFAILQQYDRCVSIVTFSCASILFISKGTLHRSRPYQKLSDTFRSFKKNIAAGRVVITHLCPRLSF